jgi:hypothetical protein
LILERVSGLWPAFLFAISGKSLTPVHTPQAGIVLSYTRRNDAPNALALLMNFSRTGLLKRALVAASSDHAVSASKDSSSPWYAPSFRASMPSEAKVVAPKSHNEIITNGTKSVKILDALGRDFAARDRGSAPLRSPGALGVREDTEYMDHWEHGGESKEPQKQGIFERHVRENAHFDPVNVEVQRTTDLRSRLSCAR